MQYFKHINLLLLAFVCLILIACNSHEQSTNTNNLFKVNRELKKSETDSLYIFMNADRNNFMRKFDDENCLCILRNDTLMIFNSEGSFTGKSMAIFISKGKFECQMKEYSCTYDHDYEPVKQSLVLNNSNYKVDDSIIGELYFSSVYDDSINNRIDTTIVKGKFKLRIRHAGFVYDSLTQERNYKDFMKEAQQRPDTIIYLRVWRCGFKSIPKELALYKNLEELEISDDDYKNADFSPLSGLTKLRKITLANCNLHQFPDVIFNFKNLVELDLWANHIDSLPTGLFQMVSLKSLKLGNNEFKTLPTGIGNLKNLEMLSLEGGYVRVFPQSIFKLTKLKSIYPSDSMDYFPPKLAKHLTSNYYPGIKNIEEFKNLVPSQ